MHFNAALAEIKLPIGANRKIFSDNQSSVGFSVGLYLSSQITTDVGTK